MTNENNLDEPIGYKNPPKSTQFKKGQSGNKSGRPRKTRDESLMDDLRAELRSLITVTENGKQIEITKQKALLKKLVNGGLFNAKDLAHAMKIILAVERIEQEKVKKKSKQEEQGGVLVVGGVLAVHKRSETVEEWMEEVSKVKMPESALRKDEIGCDPEFVVEKEPPKP